MNMNILIYQVRNRLNNHRYIGSTTRGANVRKREHFYNLRNQIHRSKYLQRAYNLYGKENFVFEVIEYSELEDLLFIEKCWIKLLQAEYNMTDETSNPMLGKTHSIETREKMSNTRNGMKYSGWSDETKKKISEERMGATDRAKDWKFVSPEGIIFEFTNLASFCRTHNLDDNHMSQVYKGTKHKHKGWTKYVEYTI